MPFTPLHFGIALPFIFWDWKKKRIDAISALIGTVIIDLRSTILFLFFNERNMAVLHSYFHSFLMATILGVIVGVFVQYTQKYWNLLLKYIHWKQKTSLFSKILIGIFFAYSHIFLDAALYPSMPLLWPFHRENFLLGWLPENLVFNLCIYGYLLGGAMFIAYIVYFNLHPEKFEVNNRINLINSEMEKKDLV